jgi:ankyrin repeat protein
MALGPSVFVLVLLITEYQLVHSLLNRTKYQWPYWQRICRIIGAVRSGKWIHPEISCDTGNNPLLRSVRAKSPECVRVLLAFGADVRRKSRLGFTYLPYAAYYRDDEALLKTLLRFGAQMDEKDNYGWTPLSCTVEYDQYKSAQVLLDNGADPNIPDNIGWTSITRAVSSNSHQVLKLLIEKGADYCSLSSRLETNSSFCSGTRWPQNHRTTHSCDNEGIKCRYERYRRPYGSRSIFF